ncbi:hypothetical protein CK203_016904 [Vitis vinifera]|uniref:Uncharacterized protein n=1 Tax=Vitis vinifera TaxID=29760 RepID=A0A438JND7_VITVI|nr:hypothetical protein CK203_016904 [Vitis vinifera]
MLEQAKGKWVEELLSVLWAYWTTLGRLTGNTYFALAYGMDAIIPMEIGLPMVRIVMQGQKNEDQELRRNLNWVDEVGTLILKRVFENTAERGARKFQANWDDPYIVSKAAKPFEAKKSYIEELHKSYVVSSRRTSRYLILVIRKE